MQLMRSARFALALSLLLCGWAGAALAQGATTGSIRGQVTSSEGRPVANAQVSAVNEETGLRRGAVTGEDGRYNIPLLPPGRYRVEAQGLGFAGSARTGVAVRLAQASPVDFALTAEAVAIEGLVVSGERARIDPTQGGVRQTVTPEQVENLPVQGRDFTDLINLSPLVSPQPGTGTGGQFSVGGARTSGTNVQVDGVDANNQFFGENRGSSRTPFAFSLESIQELQLITNGFDVEYGNYVGGVVNAVTRGGTNQFRGSGFLFYRGEALTADDFEGAPPSDFQVYQFGGNLSGPVVRDRLHFFLSADAQRKNQPIFPTGQFDPQAEVAPVVSALQGLGLENPGRFFGDTEQAEDNLVLFGRIDWSISDDHRLTFRQNFSDFEQTNDRISRDEALTHGGPFKNRSWSTVAELNSVFGASAFNTLRVQYSDEDRPRDPNTPGGFLPEIEVEVNASNEELEFGGDGIIFRNRLEETKWQLVDNFTYQIGSHRLKFGTNNTWTDVANTFWLNGNGEFEFNNVRSGGALTRTGLQNLAAATPSRYTRLVRACPVGLVANAAGQNVICPEPDVPFAQFQALEWNVYAQDEWQVSDRLLFTAGVRYGGTTFGDDPGKVEAVEQAFQVPTGVVPDFTGVSPRAAFTYDLGGDGEGLVRGGAGLLVGRAPLVLAGNVFQTERPLLSLDCRGSQIPTFNLQELLASPNGLNNPFACVGGTGPGGRPEYAVFAEEFENPRTLKANLGYERLLGARTRVGLDFIYGRTWDNFFVQDLNIRSQPVFTLPAENNRPVLIAAARVPSNFSFGAGQDRLVDQSFDRVYLNVSEGEAEAHNVMVELEQEVSAALQFGLRYAFSRAYDNGSFSCCTSREGFDEPTAGHPNFVGDRGDEESGLWGPSDFERRHTVVANFLVRAPWGIQATGIWRSQSGTPWTPTVRGDVNGDGLNFNDRAMVGPNLRFASAEDEALFDQLVAENECLQEQLGDIARRNSCRNPWFHSLDMRLSKNVRTFGGQRAEVMVDIFNVLNGLNEDWGRFMGVFGNRTDLLDVESFDVASQQYVYSVNQDFGETQPVGFDPFQFQLQLGVRYRF